MKEKEASARFPARLLAYRRERGWSQATLAANITMDEETVRRWEKGERYPTIYAQQKLCDVFHVTSDELGLTENPRLKQAHPLPLDEVFPAGASNDTGSLSEPKQTLLRLSDAQGRPHPSGWQSIQKNRLLFLAMSLILLLCFFGLWKSNVLPGGFLASHPTVIPVSHSTVPASPSGDLEAIPAAYGVQGHLVIDDALTGQQTSTFQLPNHPGQSNVCAYSQGAYDVKKEETNYCLANHTSYLANFVYQIEMTILQAQPGQTGGIVFRADDARHRYYNFQVGVDGSYSLLRSDPAQQGSDPAIWTGQTAFLKGLQEPNMLAVEARGKDLFLYVNFHLVAHVQDASYTQGNVGVGVVLNQGSSGSIEVAFRSARVWELA